MNQSLLNPMRDVMETDYNFPCVSIIMPFEPKMKSKNELVSALRLAVEKVEKKLFEEFSADIALLVIQKLSSIVKDLSFSTHKKGLAIYVSPVFEKVLYLDIELEENVLVNRSFNIRDLVKSKKKVKKYLVLQITENKCNLYSGVSTGVQKIFSYSIESVSNKTPLMPGLHLKNNQYCISCQNKDFLHRIDNTLDFIMGSHHVPLFLIGKPAFTTKFMMITKYINFVIEEIESAYPGEDTEEIKKIMMPYTSDWEKVYQKFISGQLKATVSAGKCVSGITDVFESAMHHNGRLLLVAENFQYQAAYAKPGEMIYNTTHGFSSFSYINDAIDEIIEKILDAGGDVEFVSEKIMKHYGHIVLML